MTLGGAAELEESFRLIRQHTTALEKDLAASRKAFGSSQASDTLTSADKRLD